MSKFNQVATIKTTNKSGHAAYSMTAKSKLVTQVLTSFFNEDKFYSDNSAEMQETIKEVIKQDAEFVSKLAVYARRVFNMRSVSHVLTAYLAHDPEGKQYVKETVKGVSLRGDDVTEIMSFYLVTFGKPVPNSLKKGINDVLTGFDEYVLAKYKGEGKAVKMRDLICLCRPTPKKAEQSELFKKCLENRLETPLTWETELSAHGNNKETWEKLIDSGKVGYMALLRNLRNILQTNPSNIQKVFDTLEDPEKVKKSKQLPFRFLSAYKSVKDMSGSKVLDVLENAVDASIENLPKINGTTVIAVDVSGSMRSKISAKSDIECSEIALMLAYIANKICENAYIYAFDNYVYKLTMSSRTGVLQAVESTPIHGGGTNMSLPFQLMISEKINADRVIILSDNECNSSSSFWRPFNANKTVQSYADEYRKASGNNIWVHAVDLQGYGTQQFAGAKTNIITGWSEKVLDFINLAEQGEGSLEKTIKDYQW